MIQRSMQIQLANGLEARSVAVTVIADGEDEAAAVENLENYISGIEKE